MTDLTQHHDSAFVRLKTDFLVDLNRTRGLYPLETWHPVVRSPYRGLMHGQTITFDECKSKEKRLLRHR